MSPPVIGVERMSLRAWIVRALVVATMVSPAALTLADAAAAPPRPRPGRPAKPPKPEPKPEPAAPPVTAPTLQRNNRMELDARLVRGETARSGAVYLFQRAPRRLPPLVDLEQSYLDEIVVPVLGPRGGP
ncbi:MAG: hypothetical protein IT385_05415 [Deltaproteobacteria bacterium]|nr:hypothetical protein [Deltaproteobacteria bacterium]